MPSYFLNQLSQSVNWLINLHLNSTNSKQKSSHDTSQIQQVLTKHFPHEQALDDGGEKKLQAETSEQNRTLST